VLQQRSIKKSLLLSERLHPLLERLHSLLETLKIYKARPLDCGLEQQINFLSSWEQWYFSRSKYEGTFRFHPTKWYKGLHKAVILHLMGSSATRKSSNEHDFFVAITSLNKIGEERIWDLIGDVFFPVTFKCAMLIVIRKDPRHYWCIISNNILMCINNSTDLPRPWTEVLTFQVLANRTSWPFHVSSNGRDKDTRTSTIDMTKTCKKKKFYD